MQEGAHSRRNIEVRLDWDEHNPLRPKDKRFLCNVRFKNDLPDVPCDAKMLLPPLNPRSLAAFFLTSVEKEMKRDMLLPPDLGIPVTALDIERYSVPLDDAGKMLHPADAALLGGDGTKGPLANGRSGAAAASDVTWLMRTKYITKEGVGAARRGQAAAAAATARKTATATAADTHAARVAYIEESFEAARRPPVHPKNPSATPVEVLPLLPDQLMSDRALVLAAYDGDPVADVESATGLTLEERRRLEAAAQLKSFVHRTGTGPSSKATSFAALLLPRRGPPPAAPEGLADVEVCGRDLPGDYDWVRAYDPTVKFDRGERQTFLFRYGKDHVGYTELATRLSLRKRKRAGTGPGLGGDDDEEDAFLQPEKFILEMEDAQEGGHAGDDAQRQVGGAEDASQDLVGTDAGVQETVEPAGYLDKAVDDGIDVPQQGAAEGQQAQALPARDAAELALLDAFGSDDD
jgi:RNA polymerase II-associated factor 1